MTAGRTTVDRMPITKTRRAGCRTWEFTPRSFTRVMTEIADLQPGTFAKAFWRPADGKLCLRIGYPPADVVASFGEWITCHPDGGFTVHAAPAPV
jgi:hypothetical protein